MPHGVHCKMLNNLFVRYGEFYMKHFYLVTVLLFSLMIQGCIPKYEGDPIYHQGEVSDMSALKENYTLVAKSQKASVGNYWVFYLPVMLQMPTEENDIEHKLADKLLQRFDADLLTNIKIESSYLVTLYWNQFRRHITADVWKKKD